MFIVEQNEVMMVTGISSRLRSLAVGSVRATVGIISILAPNTVGRVVFWRACRTSPAKPADHHAIAKAEQRLAHAKRSTITFGQNTVAVYTFEPDPVDGSTAPDHTFGATGTRATTTVALVHGWSGRAAFMTAFAAALTRFGFRVVAFDLPGHGSSSGRVLHVPLGVKTLHAVHEQTGPWHGIAGHSFGGLVAMAAISGTVAHIPAIPVKRFCAIASPDSARMIFDYIGQATGLGRRAQAAMDAMVIELAGRPIAAFDGAEMLRQAGVQTLLLHAPDDRETPFSGAERLTEVTKRTAPGLVMLAPVPGAGHRRILNSPEACELLAAFFHAPDRAEDNPSRAKVEIAANGARRG